MKNVIDMTARRRAQIKCGAQRISDSAPVVDMTERREAILVEERRSAKRTILTEFIGAFVIIPEQGLQKVSLYDISDDGISFDIHAEDGQFQQNQEVALRVYLTQTTYFPVVVEATHIRYIESQDVYRHGSIFVKDLVQKEALHYFVKFIESVCNSLAKDEGDLRVKPSKHP